MGDKLCCTACEASWYATEDVDGCWNCGAEGRLLITFDNKFIMSMSPSGGFTWNHNLEDLPGPADAVTL